MENCGFENNQSYPSKKSLQQPEICTTTSEVKIYKMRWYVLIMYCLIAICDNIMWNTWGPIQATARAVYDWDDYVIDLMAAWGCITFCIAMIPFAWIMDVKGLRLTMIIAAGLQFFGSTLRCIPTKENTTTTVLMHCGQFIICLAGGMSPAALISSTWFPPNQRTTATAISTVASYIGTALGFIIAPLFVDDIKDSNIPKVDNHYQLNSTQAKMYKKQINNLLYSEAGLQLIIFLVIIIYYPAKPKKPPSLSAATGRVDFKNGIKKLLKNYNFLLLATIYGASTGVYGGWCSVLYQNLSEYGISVDAKFAGWLGFVAVISGCFSGVSFSLFADRFSSHHKFFLIVFMALSFYTMLLICYVFSGVISFNEIAVYIMFGLSGFFLNGTIPFFFELGVEITYPVAEGITAGMITFFNNILQTGFLAIPLGNYGTKWMLWTTVCVCGVSTILLLFVKETYRRSSVDRREPGLNENKAN